MTRFESCPFEPTSRQANLGLDESLPRIAIFFDLQRADWQARFRGMERINLLHNAPFALEATLAVAAAAASERDCT
jgi:hypothetical protein